MTAPALPNAPQIGSTGLMQEPGIAQQVAPLLEALSQHRLANAQIEAYRGLTEERKLKAAQQARDAQDAADAATAFYKHISGSEQRLKPAQPGTDGAPQHQGVDETSGMLIPLPQFEKGLSPQAHALYLGMIGDHNKAIQQGFAAAGEKVKAEHEQVLTNIAQAGLTRDTAVRATLAKYAGTLDQPSQQAKAIADVAALGDHDTAESLAKTFNESNDRFKHVVGVTGDAYTFDGKTGKWMRQPINLGTKAGSVTPQETQMVGQQAHEIFQRMETLLKSDPNADAPSLLAQGARNVSPHGIVGALIGTAQPILQTPAQAEFAQLGDNLLHLQASLLPKGQRSISIMENLRSSFIAPGGSSGQARQSARRTRQELDRNFFVPISAGKSVDLRRFPGWTEAATAAATEGQTVPAGAVPTNAPNPADWRDGVPQ